MDYDVRNDEDIAILRSDETVPRLELIDLSSSYNQELAAFRDYLPLHAVLIGCLGKAELRMEIEVDEIDALISRLVEVQRSKFAKLEWSTYDEQMRLEFEVDYEKLGPPVLCKATLAKTPLVPVSGESGESHLCLFYTNLTWIGLFLAALQKITGRHERLHTP